MWSFQKQCRPLSIWLYSRMFLSLSLSLSISFSFFWVFFFCPRSSFARLRVFERPEKIDASGRWNYVEFTEPIRQLRCVSPAWQSGSLRRVARGICCHRRGEGAWRDWGRLQGLEERRGWGFDLISFDFLIKKCFYNEHPSIELWTAKKHAEESWDIKK